MLLVACQQKEHQPSVMFGQADEVRAADYDLEDIQASGELIATTLSRTTRVQNRV